MTYSHRTDARRGYQTASDPNVPLVRAPDRRFNRIVIAVMLVVTGYAIGVQMGWLPNVVAWWLS